MAWRHEKICPRGPLARIWRSTSYFFQENSICGLIISNNFPYIFQIHVWSRKITRVFSDDLNRIFPACISWLREHDIASWDFKGYNGLGRLTSRREMLCSKDIYHHEGPKSLESFRHEVCMQWQIQKNYLTEARDKYI